MLFDWVLIGGLVGSRFTETFWNTSPLPKGRFLSDVWLLFLIYLIIDHKWPSLAFWTTTVYLCLLGCSPENASFNVFVEEKYKYIKHKDTQEMDNSQWLLHLKRITCIEREVKQSLKVKMFATFLYPLFNIKDLVCSYPLPLCLIQ